MSKLTVVMPVYNTRKFLAEALDSIVKQTYSDFVLFVIDDGSSDGSSEVIEHYQRQDSRIVFFSQKNHGLIATLNHYFEKAESEYIARMDGDDISLPRRFERQIKYLDEHKEIGVVGTGLTYMNESLTQVIEESHFPDSHNKILWKMLYTTGLPHAPVMLRKEVFIKSEGYASHANHVEDYDFFLRAKNFTRFANIDETLYVYRKNAESVSHKFSSVQKENHFKLSRDAIKLLVPTANDECVRFLKYHELRGNSETSHVYSFLEELYSSFLLKYNPTKEEKRFIRKDWIRKLKIFSLTYKNHSFWTGIKLYLRTIRKYFYS